MKSKRHQLTQRAIPLVVLAIGQSTVFAAQNVPNGPNATHGEFWSDVVNVLKIVGIIIGGIAAFLGTLHEPKTEDKKALTRYGRLLIRLGIFGIFLAVLSQLFEWRKSKKDSEAAQKETAATLKEIRRAVTRLQSISVDMQFELPILEPSFTNYLQELTTRVQGAVKSKQHVYEGLQAVLGDRSGPVQFWIRSYSEAMPDQKRHQISGKYVTQLIPRIALRKRPIEAKSFSPPSESYRMSRGVSTNTDLVIVPEPGELSLFVSLSAYDLEFDELPTIRSITAERMTMNVPPSSWAASGEIVSFEDLSGCQAIIYFNDPRRDLSPLWEKTKISHLTLYVNGIAISIDGSKLKRDRTTFDMVYTYEFPALSPKHTH